MIGRFPFRENGYKGHYLLFDTDGHAFVVSGKNKNGQTRSAIAYRVEGPGRFWKFEESSKRLTDINVAVTLADHVCELLDKNNSEIEDSSPSLFVE